MARGRFLNVSVAKDMRLNSLSVEAELVYLLTIPHLDRDGLIEGDSDVLYGTVCPKRRIFIDRMGEFIQEWARVGLVVLYDGNDGPVLWFTGFAKNQTLRYDREAPSRFPPPPGYKFGKDGLVAVRTPPPSGSGQAISGATPEQLRTNSGVSPEADGVNPLEVYNKDQVEDQGEGIAHAHMTEPPAIPPPPNAHSFFDPRKFIKGKVSAGTGTTPMEVFHEIHSAKDARNCLERFSMETVTDTVTDLALWREVVTAWALQGHKATNVEGQLDWYKEPQRFRHDPAARSNGRMSPTDKTQAAAAELRAMLKAQGKESILHG